jgi:hypothetical protein
LAWRWSAGSAADAAGPIDASMVIARKRSATLGFASSAIQYSIG